MWIKNIQLYRLLGFKTSPKELSKQLEKARYTPVASNELESGGWAIPHESVIGSDHELVYSTMDRKQLLICLSSDKKVLPAAVVNTVTKERAKELEEQQGLAPGRKAMKDLKERVTDELIPKAFKLTKNTYVWIDLENQTVAIDSTSPATADSVIKLLLTCCEKIPFEGLRVTTSPSAAMTSWLTDDKAPNGFTIDQDAELKAPTEDKATVRYMRHTLEPKQVHDHIASGKQCTKLALTWNDRISFILTETLVIKKVTPLDILDEDKDKGTNAEERFDADFVLMTSELSRLFIDVIDALDGELEQSQAA